MKILSFVIASCVAGCGSSTIQAPAAPQEPTSPTPTQRIIQAERANNICIQRSVEMAQDWPVDEAVYQWNKNGRNKLVLNNEESACRGIVIIVESPTDKYYGNTEFMNRSIILVTVSTRVPTTNKARQHVICHELGHVLGLPHSNGDGSCMDPGKFNILPTEEDLRLVASESWDPNTVSHTALGHK